MKNAFADGAKPGVIAGRYVNAAHVIPEQGAGRAGHRMGNVTNFLAIFQGPLKARFFHALRKRPLEQMPDGRLAFADPTANLNQRLALLPHRENVLPAGLGVSPAGLAAGQPDRFRR